MSNQLVALVASAPAAAAESGSRGGLIVVAPAVGLVAVVLLDHLELIPW